MFWKNWSWPRRILAGLGLATVAALVYLAPIFARVRDNAHKGSCQSNLKQIGLALMQYTQDYDEQLPLVAVGSVDYGWANSLQPYLKSTLVYHPSRPRRMKLKRPRITAMVSFPRVLRRLIYRSVLEDIDALARLYVSNLSSR